MVLDFCTCGKTKDRRSVQCRFCFRLEPKAKVCRGCGVSHPIASYSLRPNGRGGYKRRSRCKPCEAKAAKRHRNVNPSSVRRSKRTYNTANKSSVRRWGRRATWRKNGLNPDEIEQLLEKHDGKCEICHRDKAEVGTLHADHCHDKKMFRGFICSSCNLALGLFGHDIARLFSATAYLLK